jgi:hypothetical protein
MWGITSAYACFQRFTLGCVRQNEAVFVRFGESSLKAHSRSVPSRSWRSRPQLFVIFFVRFVRVGIRFFVRDGIRFFVRDGIRGVVRNSDFSSSVARITSFSIPLTCSVALRTVRLRWYIVWHAISCYDHVPGLPPTCLTTACSIGIE